MRSGKEPDYPDQVNNGYSVLIHHPSSGFFASEGGSLLETALLTTGDGGIIFGSRLEKGISVEKQVPLQKIVAYESAPFEQGLLHDLHCMHRSWNSSLVGNDLGRNQRQ